MSISPLRIFISSPSDVNAERAAASRVIDRLAREFGGFFAIQAELWEQEPLRATAHFQEQIPRPSEADIVLVIVWSRLGTQLPANRFKGILTGETVTGTEWEFEDAASAFREHGKPDLLFYRKIARIDVSLEDDALVEKRRAEKGRLDAFLHKWFFTDTAEFKAAFSTFETTHEFEQVVEHHLRRLIQQRVDALDVSSEAAAPARWQSGSPFRGLEPFDVEHAGIFYGRSKARAELRETLAAKAEQGSAFVLLLGMSGSGKSSLVRAALIPDLCVPGVVEHVGLFRYGIARPSDAPDAPLTALARALVSQTALPEFLEIGWPVDRIQRQLHDKPEDIAPALAEALKLAGSRAGLLQAAKARVVLLIDQLEELFTTATLAADKRDRFVSAMRSLVESRFVWVVATMRSDMFHHLAAAPILAEMAEGKGQYHLLPPQPVEISQMIREPAAAAGLRFEVDPKTNIGLDEVLHQEMEDDPAALPLLEFTLDELFRARTPRGVLTYEAYRRLGGLDGALAKRAEETYSRLSPEAQAAFDSVATGLATPQKNANGFAARRAPLAEFEDEADQSAVVQAFIASRLFVADSSERAGGTIRVAHEALFRSWPRLREILEKNVNFLATRERLAVAAERWASEGKAADMLLVEGRALAEAQEILQTHSRDIDSVIKDFVIASLEYTRRRHTRTLRITQAVAAGFGLIALIAGGAGWIAWQNRQAAEHARSEAIGQRDAALRSESFFLSAVSLKLTRAGNPLGGAQLARAALPKNTTNPDRPIVSDAVNALAGALAEIGPLRGTIRQSDAVAGMFLPDGAIATIAGKEPLRISTAPFGKPFATYGPGSPGGTWVSTDGARVAVRYGEQIRFFDRKSGRQVAATDLSVHGEPLFQVFLNGDLSLAAALYAPAGGKFISLPSGKLIKTLDASTVIAWAGFSSKSDKVLWTSVTGSFVADLRHPGVPIALGPLTAYPAPAVIAKSSGLVVVGCKDGIVRLWRLSSPKNPMALKGNTAQIFVVGFDPTSRHVFSISKDAVLRSWSVSRGQPEFDIADVVPDAGLTFTPDGGRFAVAGAHHEIRIYDAATGKAVGRLAGHGAPITALSYSPDGRYLLSTSTDRTARVWEPGHDLGLTPADSSKALNTVGFTSGNIPFAVDSGGTVSVWRSGTASPPASVSTKTDFMHVVALDAKATVIGFSPLNSNAQLWSLRGPTGSKPLSALSNLGMFATNVSISADGSRALMTGISGAAVLLDGHTGAVVGQVHLPWTAHGALSSDGRVALIWSEAKVWLRDGRTFAPIAAFQVGKRPAALFLAPDGRSVLNIEHDGAVALRDGRSGTVIRSLKLADLSKAVFAESTNGRWVATLDERGKATILDIERCAVVARGSVGTAAPQFAAMSPNSQALTTMDKAGTVTLWSLPDFRPLFSFSQELMGSSPFMQIAGFSPDGRALAVRWHDNQIRLWPTSLQELLKLTDQTVAGPLTKDERTQLILSYE